MTDNDDRILLRQFRDVLLINQAFPDRPDHVLKLAEMRGETEEELLASVADAADREAQRNPDAELRQLMRMIHAATVDLNPGAALLADLDEED